MNRLEEISINLEIVKQRISAAAGRVNRKPEDVTLIVVTKTFPLSDVEILRSLSVINFGENRDSEAVTKAFDVTATWHFQGQIQSNKLKSITSWANVIHSLDEIKHFETIEKIAKRPLKIFCQVSLDKAEGRGGIKLDELYSLASRVQESNLHELAGLMAVAPLGIEPAQAFEQLAQIHQRFLKHFPNALQLSAGMSNDFEAAIAHGATHIRVGSSILGSRTFTG
jgi:hypothetical protein